MIAERSVMITERAVMVTERAVMDLKGRAPLAKSFASCDIIGKDNGSLTEMKY